MKTTRSTGNLLTLLYKLGIKSANYVEYAFWDTDVNGGNGAKVVYYRPSVMLLHPPIRHRRI